MQRVLVIGGTGHIGSFLVPRLVEAGYGVTVVHRGRRAPYTLSQAWKSVTFVQADREQEERAGTFGALVAEAHPEIVVDLICYTVLSCRKLVEGLPDTVKQVVSCGSIWVHGTGTARPSQESDPYQPLCEYGRQKAAIETYLLHEAARDFQASVIHPGHISGPGWIPINPAGNLNIEVFTRLAEGRPIRLPNLGLDTLHHVHSDDVARLFMRVLECPESAEGEAFHAVSPRAIPLRAYAETVASWFGQAAGVSYLPFNQWKETETDEDAAITLNHIERSPCCSMEKAEKLLAFRSEYSSMETVRQSLFWLKDHQKWRTDAEWVA